MAQITYDNEGDILNIRISKSKIVDSNMFNDCVFDYDKDGEIVNIEVLNFNAKEFIKQVKTA